MNGEPLGDVKSADRHWLTNQRMLDYSAMVLVIFGIAIAVWILLSLPSLVDLRGKPIGYDFIAFWSAARLAVMGHPASAFDWVAIEAVHRLAVPGLGGKVF